MTAIWAHRGASAVERENSLAAFAAAVRMGADGIELDVRRTADGAPAVHHDAILPDGRPIAEVRAAELPPHVPLLDAALGACGDLLVNIEIKEPPELAELVVAVVRDRGMADRVLVSCFDLATIDRVRARDDGIPTAYLVLFAPDGDWAGQVDICRRGGHAALHPHHVAVDAPLVELAHQAGVAINTWTVDEPARVLELADIGVDAVITNVPDVALRALSR
ncbi:MAG: ugpQ [Acidimicrobiales bacterium]|nr:ugpQ [Acidimicrobiales bacterium]